MSSFADDPAIILASISDPIVVVDDRLIITGANQAAVNLVGAESVQDLIGRSGVDWVHEPDRIDAVDRLAALTEARQPSPVSLRLSRLDGSLVWVEITGAVVAHPTVSSRVVLGFRNVDWRHDADIDATRVVRRSHALVTAALDLQSSTSKSIIEVLDAVVDRIGNAVGAQVVVVHEVEPDGATMSLRARWVGTRGGRSLRELPASTIPLDRVPNWVNALNSSRRGVAVHTDRLDIQAELVRIEPAVVEGSSLALYPGERLLGALTVGFAPGTRLSSDEHDFLDRAAEIIGVAFQRIRSQQALIESEAMFRDLFEGSSAIMYLVDPVSLRLVDANEAASRFYGYPRAEMAGMDLHELTVHTRSELQAMIDRVRAGGTTVIDEQQLLSSGEQRMVEIHSTPMRLGNRTLDLAIIQDVTEQRRAVEHLERLASTDDLTGAHNRRRFLQVVAAEIERSKRYDRHLSLLMLDLDHFKSVNDNYGHLAGDAVLVAFTQEIREHLRASDRVGRMGGEEFAVVLPETDLADARVLADRIRTATEKLIVPEVHGPPPCTVSIGGAQWEPGWTLDDLFAHADRMLYRAKNNGRNRFEG